MVTAGQSLERSVQEAYAAASADVEFGTLLERQRPNGDEQLADLIETDGRVRLSLGRPIELVRYLESVPGLAGRSIPLDAAIDLTLRSLTASEGSHDRAVETLVFNYPQLREAILEAAALAQAIWSTSELRRRMAPAKGRALPCDFGPALPNGTRRYQLRRPLGEGAWGRVYLAIDRQLSEQGHAAFVAIKVLASVERDEWARQRLIDEATKARRVIHPNVVRVLDRGITEDDEDYVVYDFVEGGDLHQWAGEQAGPIAQDTAARLVARIARGVQAAHAAGLLHCDLKPSNIILSADNEPRIADFGIALRAGERVDRRTDENRPIGNLAFMSPEQYRAEDGSLSAATDVYALGGILYFLLTGRHPHGETAEEIGKTHGRPLEEQNPPRVRKVRPGVDRDLEAICRRALAPRPEDRYGAAAMLADDLEAWLRREPIEWTRPGTLRRAHLFVVRRPAVSVAFLLATLSIITGTGLAWRYSLIAVLRDQQAADATLRLSTSTAQMENLAQLLIAARKARFDRDLLPMVMQWEWLFGPTVLGSPERKWELWNERVTAARGIIEYQKAHGGADHFETLFWESALGFWLLSAGEAADAEPQLAQNVERWRKILRPDDPWLKQLELMHAGAIVDRLRRQAETGRIDTGPDSEARRVEAILRNEERAWGGRGVGHEARRVILGKMIDLYGPALLNDPARLREVRKALKDID